MKRKIFSAVALSAAMFLNLQCTTAPADPVANALEVSELQLAAMTKALDAKDKLVSPRTFEKGQMVYHDLESWTSGFFPGSLWYLYELTGKEEWKQRAVKYTEGMEHIKYFTDNHDIGFMIYCSFGNGLRLTHKDAYKEVIVTAAESLITRYRPGAAVIQSWNSNQKWQCPVIIDNMMNLELLFEASLLSGDPKYRDIAIAHANTTMKHHYRDNYSCVHVVDYNPETGEVLNRNTHQGYSDASAWSRGQAWGIYGYTLCYRYTKDKAYLDQANKIAHFIFTNPTLPEDLVPYWDYDVPNITSESRDASAASVTASALYELYTYTKDEQQKGWADKIVNSLSSDAYLAKVGENGNFILLHSVGSKPHGAEYDAPLPYADYYYLEAIKRKRDLEKKN